VVDLAVTAEDLGLDSVWVGDSILARPRLDPLPMLSAVAHATRRVTVGTAAFLAAARQPVTAAHAIATVDRIAEGRLVLAVGSGFPSDDTRAEFEACGAPYDGRGRRLHDTVRRWRAMWAGEVAPDDPVARLPGPSRSGGPPVWLAGGTDRALRAVGRLYDGWLPYPPTPEAYAAGWEQVTDAATAAGREPGDITPALYATLVLADTAEAAAEEADAYVSAYYGLPLELLSAFQTVICGPPEACVERLRSYVEAGARHVILRFGSRRVTEQLWWAVAEVVPAFRETVRSA